MNESANRRQCNVGSAGRHASARKLLLLLIALSCMAALTAIPLAAQSANEYQVKTGFVFNLTKYVEWPQNSQVMNIGFVGDSPMGEVLKSTLSGRTTGSKSIQVTLSPSEQELDQMDLLYISYASERKTRGILEKLHNHNTLTVGDSDWFARDGGMIGLVTVSDHVQIQANLDALQESRLKVSSRLLSLAVVLRRGGTK